MLWAVMAGGWWFFGYRSGHGGTGDANATVVRTPAGAVGDALGRLKGRWERVDGGYVIEIRSVAADGALEAAYFNPAPIHVSRANATSTDGVVRVFVELRDVNYPGSTYTLAYDPARDVLEGTYFQALERQQFDVAFVRRP